MQPQELLADSGPQALPSASQKRSFNEKEDNGPDRSQKLRAVENEPLINRLREKLEDRKEECRQLKAQLDDWEHQFLIKVAETEKVLEEKVWRTSKDVLLMRTNNELKEMINTLKTEKASDLEKHRQVYAQAATELTKSRTERDKHLRNYNILQTEYTELKMAMKSLENQVPGGNLRQLRKDYQALESNFKSLQQELHQREAEYTSLQDLLGAKDASEAALNATIVNLETRRAQESSEQLRVKYNLLAHYNGKFEVPPIDPEGSRAEATTNHLTREAEEDIRAKLKESEAQRETELYLLETLKKDSAILKSDYKRLEELARKHQEAEQNLSQNLSALQQDLDSERQSHKELQNSSSARLQDLEEKQIVAERARLAAEAERNTALAAVKKLQDDLEKEVSRTKELQHSLTEKQELAQKLEDRIAHSENKEVQAVEVQVDLQEQLRMSRQAQLDLQSELDSLRSDYDKSQDNIIASQLSNQTLTTRLSALEQDLVSATKIRQQLEAERLQADRKRLAAEQTHENNLATMHRFEGDIANQNSRIEALEKSLSEKDNELRASQQTEVLIRAELDTFQDATRNKQESEKALKDQIKDLQQQINQQHSLHLQEMEEKQQEISCAVADCKDLKERHENGLAECRVARQSYEHIQAQFRQAEKHNASQESEASKLREQIRLASEGSQEVHRQYQGQIQSLEEKLRSRDVETPQQHDIHQLKLQLQTQNDSLKSEISQLQEQLTRPPELPESAHHHYQGQIQALEEKLRAAELQAPQQQVQLQQFREQLEHEKQLGEQSAKTAEENGAEIRQLRGEIFDLEMNKVEMMSSQRVRDLEAQKAKEVFDKQTECSTKRIRELEAEVNQLKPNGIQWVSQSRFDALNNSFEQLKAELAKARSDFHQSDLARGLYSWDPQTNGASQRDYISEIVELKRKLSSSERDLNSARLDVQPLKQVIDAIRSNVTPTLSGLSEFDRGIEFLRSSWQRPPTNSYGERTGSSSSSAPFPASYTEQSRAASGEFAASQSFDSTDEDFSATAGTNFLMRTHRETLKEANVGSALQEAHEKFAVKYPRYQLGQELERPLIPYPRNRKLWQKNKPSIYAGHGRGNTREEPPQNSRSQPNPSSSTGGQERATRDQPNQPNATDDFEDLFDDDIDNDPFQQDSGTQPNPGRSWKGKERATQNSPIREADDLFGDDDFNNAFGQDSGSQRNTGSSRKGKERANPDCSNHEEEGIVVDSDSSFEQDSDVENNSDRGGKESNDSKTRRMYARQGILKDSWNNDETRRQISELGRLIVREALHVDRNNEAFARRGVKLERLKKFYAIPKKYGPKLVNTRFDKIGSDTEDLLDSDWNRALIHALAELAAEIVANCQDPDRFGPNPHLINWHKLVRERLYRIFLSVIKAQPQFEGETRKQIADRLEVEHKRICKRNAEVFSRHQKWKDRCDISAIMVQVCCQRGDRDGVAFWEYALLALDHFKEGGMSEDEEGVQTRRTNGRKSERRKKVIKELFFRHPSFTKLFTGIDATPGVEDIIFHQKGRPRITRERIDTLSFREPPKNLSRAVLRDEYLSSLAPYQVAELDLSTQLFPIFDFDYDPAQHLGIPRNAHVPQ